MMTMPHGTSLLDAETADLRENSVLRRRSTLKRWAIFKKTRCLQTTRRRLRCSTTLKISRQDKPIISLLPHRLQRLLIPRDSPGIIEMFTWLPRDVRPIIPRIDFSTRRVVDQLKHELPPLFFGRACCVDLAERFLAHVAQHVDDPVGLDLDAGWAVGEGGWGLRAVGAGDRVSRSCVGWAMERGSLASRSRVSTMGNRKILTRKNWGSEMWRCPNMSMSLSPTCRSGSRRRRP